MMVDLKDRINIFAIIFVYKVVVCQSIAAVAILASSNDGLDQNSSISGASNHLIGVHG